MKKRSFWVLFAVIVLVGAFLMVFLSSQNQLPVVTDVNAQMNGMGSYGSLGPSIPIFNPPIGLGIGLLVETTRDYGMGGIIDTEKFCSSFTITDSYEPTPTGAACTNPTTRMCYPTTTVCPGPTGIICGGGINTMLFCPTSMNCGSQTSLNCTGL